MATATPYEELVESAASLTDTDLIADVDGRDIAGASAFLRQNHVALESARRVLGPHCAVPLRYDESFYSEHCDHFSHLRNLARALRADARLAAHNHEYQATARIGLEILELANAVRRGGLVTDLLVGIAISGIAIEILRKNRTNFDQATRHSLIHELQRLDDEREQFATVLVRDCDWEVALGYDDKPCDFTSQELSNPKDCGLSEEQQRALFQLMQQIVDLPKADQQKMYLDIDRRSLASMRMLIIDLALRDRCESSGFFAEHLSALVPELLPRVPVDPFTDTSFIYRSVGGTSFHLYSTGPKMSDGGGKIGPWPLVAAGCADLYLDADDYWPKCCEVPGRQGLVNRMASAIRRCWRRSRAKLATIATSRLRRSGNIVD